MPMLSVLIGLTQERPECEYATKRGFAKSNLLRIQVNPAVKSDLSRGVGIPYRTVVAIHLYERTCSRSSQLISAIIALGD